MDAAPNDFQDTYPSALPTRPLPLEADSATPVREGPSLLDFLRDLLKAIAVRPD